MDMIIPTNLVCILFGPPIPTSPFNFIVFYTCVLCNRYITGAKDVWHLLHRSTRAINALHIGVGSNWKVRGKDQVTVRALSACAKL